MDQTKVILSSIKSVESETGVGRPWYNGRMTEVANYSQIVRLEREELHKGR